MRKFLAWILTVALLLSSVSFPAFAEELETPPAESGTVAELPTPVPTEAPTPVPTEVPTPEPTAVPTEVPIPEPTAEPTEEPTPEPTAEPTEEPAPAPTAEPAEAPTPEADPVPGETDAPEASTEPTALEPTAEPTPAPFVKGYVRVQSGTIAYKAANKQEEAGTFTSASVVYAEAAKEGNDFNSSWLKITFDTEDAKESNASFSAAFVLGQNVKVLEEAEVTQLNDQWSQDRTMRRYGSNLLPVASFTAKAEETAEPVAEPTAEPTIEPAEPVEKETPDQRDPSDAERDQEPTDDSGDEIVSEQAENEEPDPVQNEEMEQEPGEDQENETRDETAAIGDDAGENQTSDEDAQNTDATTEEPALTDDNTEEVQPEEQTNQPNDESLNEEESNDEQGDEPVIIVEESYSVNPSLGTAADTAVKIKTNPVSVSANLGASVQFTVVAENAESYQWQYSQDGKNFYNCGASLYGGTTTAKLTVAANTNRNGWLYRCVVTGGRKTVESEPAILTVKPAVKITANPNSVSANVGTSVQFTVVAENAETYQWQYSRDGENFYNCGASLYTGTEEATLTAAANANRNGWQYRCIVTGGGKTVESEPATLTVKPAVKITTNPESVTANLGSSVQFTVEAENAETYQWQYSSNGTDFYNCGASLYTGTKEATLTAAANANRNGWQYRCIVTGGGKTVESEPATLTVKPAVKITTNPESVSANLGSSVQFTVVAENAETYQWQYSSNGTDFYNCGASLYTGTKEATLTAAANANRNGWQYRCVVTGGGKTVESEPATLTVKPAVKITTNPESVTANLGSSVQFTVIAENAETYQWQYSSNGTDFYNCGASLYTGTKEATLTAAANANRNGWQYRCIVTGGGKTVESEPATLTVKPAVKITTNPESVTANLGSSVQFTVIAENAETYQWQYSSNGTDFYNCGASLYSGTTTAKLTVLLIQTITMDQLLLQPE